MKVSEITKETLKTFLRLNDEELDEVEETELDMILSGAKAYVKSYTGYTDSELDEYKEITLAVLVVAQDMYDDRSMLVDKDKMNLVLKTTLGMHQKNLL
jgi:hypothetical protein